jgi:hypothetical protein
LQRLEAAFFYSALALASRKTQKGRVRSFLCGAARAPGEGGRDKN